MQISNTSRLLSLHSLATFLLAALGWLAGAQPATAASGTRPNIVIFLADDMGFSDINCYGSEIETPTLNTLSTNGLRYTRFYNTARCSPSRTSLLTGLYSWEAGIGHLVENYPLPGYTPALNHRCITIAEALRANGYHTFMTGKWHVGGMTTNQLPCQRGFDRFFGRLVNGSDPNKLPDPGGYYATSFWSNNIVVSGLPAGYDEDRYVQYGTNFIGKSLDQTNAPFFYYCAFPAPHYPVTAPPEGIGKYRYTFLDGWEPHRQARFARQKDLGIVNPNWALSPPDHGVLWSTLTSGQQDTCDLAMATHAAMVENIDSNIGRLVSFLKARGVYTNTIVFFMSDNGASDETKSDLISDSTHLRAVGANWANTPYRLYKMHTREGGISTPLVVHWPAGITNNFGLRWQPSHLIDLMPTCLELAGASYPSNFGGNPITPLEGTSLVRTFSDTNIAPRVLFFEHEGNRAIRTNDWKLSADGRTGPWELYDLSTDGTETTNLAATYPDLVNTLSNTWEAMSWRVWDSPSPDSSSLPTTKMRFWPSVSDSATGNGDGYGGPGETVDLNLLTIKQGSGVNTGLVGTLTSSDPRVTILSNTAAFSDFSAGTASNLTPFRIQIASNMPPNDTILFGLGLSSGGTPQWGDCFALLVRCFNAVSGTVADLGNNDPIPQTVVSGGTIASSATDRFGRYSLLLETGQYTISAQGPAGYAPTQQVFQVSAQPQQLPVWLAWTNTGLSVGLKRPSTASVSIPTNTALLLMAVVHNGPSPGGGPFTVTWSNVSGPAPAVIGSPTQADTPVSFPLPGTYLLNLVADNGSLQATQNVQVTVGADLTSIVEPATNNLNVWLKFDDASGTTTAADSAHANNSPLLNMNAATAWSNPGIRGGCLTFDGVDDVVNLPNSSDSNGSINHTRTVCLWFYAENPDSSSRQVLYDDGGVTRGMNFYLQNGVLTMGAWNTPTTESSWSGTWLTASGIQAHRWYHAALTLNGGTTITSDALIGYLDGLEIGRGRGSQIWGRGSKNGLGAMYDATLFPDSAPTGNGLYFSGRLDDFRIYERVLSPSELSGMVGGGISQAIVQVNAGPDVLNHGGLQVPLQPAIVTYGTPTIPPYISWETLAAPSAQSPVFSLPDTNGVPTLASVPQPGAYTLRLVADTGDIATCDDLNISAFSGFNDWIAAYPGLPSGQQGPDADPDGDGIPNRLEYELGTPPDAAGSTDDKGRLNLAVAADNSTLELSFLLRRDAASRGLTYGVKTCPSLGATAWTDQTYTLTAIEDTADYNFQRIRLSLTPGSPQVPAFIRVWFAE